ncbi:hypothetical protein Tco_0588293 [Tanacetum coccineum]
MSPQIISEPQVKNRSNPGVPAEEKLFLVEDRYPVAIVASRAVDPVGSPLSTTIDQDEQSTSTSPTKGVEE